MPQYKIKVYIEHSSNIAAIKQLKREGIIEKYHRGYDQPFYKATKAKCSSPTLDKMNIHWENINFGTYEELIGSDKLDDIIELIGHDNILDCLHLDSAYKENCVFLISTDKRDIISKRKEIYDLLKIIVLDANDDDVYKIIKDYSKSN